MKKGAKIAIVIIGILVIASVITYILRRRARTQGIDLEPMPITPAPSGIASGGGSSFFGTSPFKNRDEGNRFRKWINDTYPSYAREIDLDPTGSHTNVYIMKAWDKYGQAYKTYQSSGGGGSTTTSPTDQNKKSYQASQYHSFADILESVFNAGFTGYLVGSYSNIKSVFEKIKTKEDYYSMKKAYGTRGGKDLYQAMKSAMNQDELNRYVNRPMQLAGAKVWVK